MTLPEIATQRHSQPSTEQRIRTSKRCKIWKGGQSEGTAAQRGDHAMLMERNRKSPSPEIVWPLHEIEWPNL